MRRAIAVLSLLVFPLRASAFDFNPIQAVGNVVQGAANAVGNAGAAIGQAAGDLVKAGGGAIAQAGNVIESAGGDVAKTLAAPFHEAGAVVEKVGDAGAALAVSGVARPTQNFVSTLGSSVQDLAAIDLENPESLLNVVQKAAGAASGVVSDTERTLERAAMDAEDIAVTALPAPAEQGVRHASGEVIRELEKKNPDLARLLRQLPTSTLYNHLRNLAGDAFPCDADKVFPFLDAEPRKKLDAVAKWGAYATTPLGKQLGISGWTSTNCRGTAMGVLVRDAAYSADNIVTIDVMLSALNVGGAAQPVAGRFLRVEILPIGRAHAFALYHPLKEGEAILTSGKIVRDEDGPWFEIHPVDDLEVISVPATSAAPAASIAGHLTAPPREDAAARFTFYVVQKGDSLSRIAERFYGRQAWPTLVAANRSFQRNPDLIHPGWKLNIPIQTTMGLATTMPIAAR